MPHPRFRRLFSASSTRSVEWLMTFFMLGWAVTLALPGDTLAISTYKDFRALGLTDASLAVAYGAIGTVRLVLLWQNGSLSAGPEVRFLCSTVSAFTWLFTAVLFALPWVTTRANLPVSCLHHLIMFFAEIYTIGVNAVDRQQLRR